MNSGVKGQTTKKLSYFSLTFPYVKKLLGSDHSPNLDIFMKKQCNKVL